MQNLIDIQWARSNSTVPPAGEFLSPGEVEKYSKLRFPQRRADWLLGRWTAKQLLHTSVEQLSGLHFAEWTVANEGDGRPYASLSGRRLPGCLSISHRGGQAVCAWSSNAHIGLGIDLEIIEPRTNAFIQDYLTDAEQILAAGRQREGDAVLIWSAKEAMLKAMGTGLRLDTRSVEVMRIGNNETLAKWYALEVHSRVQEEFRWWAGWQTAAETVLTLAVCTGEMQLDSLQIHEVIL
ncbi:MAG TPA: 4'-phosphopantetheinyl transferase superfamily protein [Longilinea sp.]|nr:4'-phosphopantetheinyl transferase superfamily protein [Longilinea sp.]